MQLVILMLDHQAGASIVKVGTGEWRSGTKIDCLATEYDLKQVINEPAYLLENSSSIIDLMFTSQPNLVMDA